MFVEEHALQGPPSTEPLAFVPVSGTMAEVRDKHWQASTQVFTENSFSEGGLIGLAADLGGEQIRAFETYSNTVTTKGTFQKATVHVARLGQEIYSIPAGDGTPVKTLQGLWTYDNHWVLEIAYAAQKFSLPGLIDVQAAGQIVRDGDLLNQRFKYQEAFGFQTMGGKPFYFFKRGGHIGISYDDQDYALGYDQVDHYLCCSGSALNPKAAESMVAFFARRAGTWYYVEIGVK